MPNVRYSLLELIAFNAVEKLSLKLRVKYSPLFISEITFKFSNCFYNNILS